MRGWGSRWWKHLFLQKVPFTIHCSVLRKSPDLKKKMLQTKTDNITINKAQMYGVGAKWSSCLINSSQTDFTCDDKRQAPCRFLTSDHKIPQCSHHCDQWKWGPSLPSVGCLDKASWPSNSSTEMYLDSVQPQHRAYHLQTEWSQRSQIKSDTFNLVNVVLLMCFTYTVTWSLYRTAIRISHSALLFSQFK